MKLKKLLAEVEKLDQAAAMGPWMTDHDDTAVDSVPHPLGDWIVEPKDGEVNESHRPENMRFIARSRTLLPDLARRLKLAVEALGWARETLSRGSSRVRWYILEKTVNEALDKIEEPPKQ